MRRILHKINTVISNLLAVLALVFLVMVIFNVYQAKKNGTEYFFFGYRPIYVLTGSMEPVMRTNCLCLTKQVKPEDPVEVGDIVTFRTLNSAGLSVPITHRIIEISDDGFFTTKGDNNNAPDAMMLRREDIQSKVVYVWNGFATIVAMTDSAYFIPAIIGFAVVVALGCVSVQCLKPDKREEDDEDVPIEEIDDPQ